MAVVLTWQRSTPGQPQYGLATLTESYKVQNDDGSQITAAAVLVDGSVPQIGDAHPDYSAMFCTDRHCAETGESASALDVTYTGILGMDLPLGQATQGHSIASASSSTSFFHIYSLSPAATLQFYAPTNTLTWISTAPGEAGPSGDVIVPTEDVVIFSYNLPPPYSLFTGDWYAFVRFNFFTDLTTTVIQSTEIVAGRYWSNVATATKTIIPAAGG